MPVTQLVTFVFNQEPWLVQSPCVRGQKYRLVVFLMTPQNYTILESSLCSINDCWWPNFQLPKSPPSHFHRSEMMGDLGGVHLHKQGSSWSSEPKPQRSREAPGWQTISSVMKTSKCYLKSHITSNSGEALWNLSTKGAEKYHLTFFEE